MEMQVVDAARVHALLDYPGLIEAFRQAHMGGMPKHGGRFLFSEPNADAQADALILLPAWQPGEGILVKMVTSFPLNKERHNLATVQSLYVYLNGATGVPEAAAAAAVLPCAVSRAARQSRRVVEWRAARRAAGCGDRGGGVPGRSRCSSALGRDAGARGCPGAGRPRRGRGVRGHLARRPDLWPRWTAERQVTGGPTANRV
jgi:hypothetical protein